MMKQIVRIRIEQIDESDEDRFHPPIGKMPTPPAFDEKEQLIESDALPSTHLVGMQLVSLQGAAPAVLLKIIN
jgi:hypothetical protein